MLSTSHRWLLAYNLLAILLAGSIASLALASLVKFSVTAGATLAAASGFLLFCWLILLTIRSMVSHLNGFDLFFHTIFLLFDGASCFYVIIQTVQHTFVVHRIYETSIVTMYLVQIIVSCISYHQILSLVLTIPESSADEEVLSHKLEKPFTRESASDKTVVTATEAQLDNQSFSYFPNDVNESTEYQQFNANNWMDPSVDKVDQSLKQPIMSSKSVPNFVSNFHKESNQESGIRGEESLFHISEPSDNSLHKYHNSGPDPALSSPVKRSKSTSYLNSAIKVKKREQRNKSISDEKAFLSNVNPSLLPPVLRQGESPIMEVKRKQLAVLEPSETILEEDDDNSLNLPHISEFDEPIDQTEFEGFDQNTRLVSEKYEHSLSGLENIPESMDKNWLQKRRVVSSPLNYISYSDWQESLGDYRISRSRSGANLGAIPGIALVSKDTNMKLVTETYEEHDYSNNFLMPPLANGVDNIDSLSDIRSESSRRAYSHSNRSFSAPSLHTFRKVSSNSVESEGPELTRVESVEYLCRYSTPEPEEEKPKHTSPIRRLLSESPKKLSSVFRRKSIATIDLSHSESDHNSGHRHSKSVISNQNSMASMMSSRSASPKRSLKSLLPTVSHKKNLSTNSFSSVYQSSKAIKHNISFVNKLAAAEIHDDNWEINTRKSSSNYCISTVPSSIIGEYDREKWRKLNELQAFQSES